jgi:protein tyrosine/serine phosphatase
MVALLQQPSSLDVSLVFIQVAAAHTPQCASNPDNSATLTLKTPAGHERMRRRGRQQFHVCSSLFDVMLEKQAHQERNCAGKKVYMHCWGGRGRAGVVGACLLMKLYGISADEALERVQCAFSTRKDTSKDRSPETDAQMEFVRNFCAGPPSA